ncbi:MAG: hypothetical protein J5758_01955, partial [Abditibacteriota bacterium]|nr:hypothetical protein [Abditibacteriota bacterium]
MASIGPKELRDRFYAWTAEKRRRAAYPRTVIPGLLELLDPFRSTESLKKDVRPYLARSVREDHTEAAKGLAKVFDIKDKDAFVRKYLQLIQADPANAAALEKAKSLPLDTLLYFHRDISSLQLYQRNSGNVRFCSDKTALGFRNPSPFRGETGMADAVLWNKNAVVFLIAVPDIDEKKGPAAYVGKRYFSGDADPLVPEILGLLGIKQGSRTALLPFICGYIGVLLRIIDRPALNGDNGLGSEEEEINALIAGGAEVYVGAFKKHRSDRAWLSYNNWADRMDRATDSLNMRAEALAAVLSGISGRLEERGLTPEDVVPGDLRRLANAGKITLTVID